MTTAIMYNINKCKFTQFLALGTGQHRKSSPGTDLKFPEIIHSSPHELCFQGITGRRFSTSTPLFRNRFENS